MSREREIPTALIVIGQPCLTELAWTIRGQAKVKQQLNMEWCP